MAPSLGCAIFPGDGVGQRRVGSGEGLPTCRPRSCKISDFQDPSASGVPLTGPRFQEAGNRCPRGEVGRALLIKELVFIQLVWLGVEVSSSNPGPSSGYRSWGSLWNFFSGVDPLHCPPNTITCRAGSPEAKVWCSAGLHSLEDWFKRK